MPRQKITFAGADGAELAARLDLPLGDARAYAIFAHCFTCSKDTKAAAYVSAALAEQGIAMLRFDFTGLGGSGVDFANCDTKAGKIDRIEREITIEGDLDRAQREKLLEIANKCPVHRTLHSEVWIPTRLAGG